MSRLRKRIRDTRLRSVRQSAVFSLTMFEAIDLGIELSVDIPTGPVRLELDRVFPQLQTATRSEFTQAP